MLLQHHTHLLGIVSLFVAALAAATRPGAVWRLAALALAAMSAAITGGVVDWLHDAVDEGLRNRDLYHGHAAVQRAIMVVGAIALPAAAAAIVARWTGPARAMLLALLALAALFAVQAVSLHAIDAVLARPVGPVMTVALAWLACAVVVVAAAMADARR